MYKPSPEVSKEIWKAYPKPLLLTFLTGSVLALTMSAWEEFGRIRGAHIIGQAAKEAGCEEAVLKQVKTYLEDET